MTVLLTTAALTPGTIYTLTVSNVLTAAGVPLPASVQQIVRFKGGVAREYWQNIGSGTTIDNLTNPVKNPNYPGRPSGRTLQASFEAPQNQFQDSGERLRAYLYPPITGNYTFWIAADNVAELWLSSDDNPAHKSHIALVPGMTGSRQWTLYSWDQQSAPVYLAAGQHYYIKAVQKQGASTEHLAVAWQMPGYGFDSLPISGSYLSPYVDPPAALPATVTVAARVTFDRRPSLGGTVSDSAAAVTLSLGGDFYAAVNNGDGTWTFDGARLPADLADGVYSIEVERVQCCGPGRLRLDLERVGRRSRRADGRHPRRDPRSAAHGGR